MVSTDPRPASEAGEPAATGAPAPGPDAAAIPAKPRSSRRRNILLLIAAVIALDVVASIVVPPFPIGEPDKPVTGIGDLIMANLEFPAPHVIWPVKEACPEPVTHECEAAHAVPLISSDI